MTISVIIPVKGDPRIVRCLDALARQTLPEDRFEVVVVDNGPDQFVERLAERFNARYVRHAEGGSYAARARGAAEARGACLVFTDADCVPPPGWLAHVETLFRDPACMVAIGPSSTSSRSAVSRWVQSIDQARWDELVRVERIAYCDTRNLAIRRELLSAVPFDPAFRHAGDLDLGLRLHKHGIPITIAAELRLEHEHPASLVAVLRRGIRRGRGVAQLQRKHGSLTGATGARPLVVLGVDLKEVVLERLDGRAWRVVFGGVAAASLIPVAGALTVLARVPPAVALGSRLFVIFDRLSLLLGRLSG